MSLDTGWFYTGGQLRYKDADGWTEQYKAIESKGATTKPVKGNPTDKAIAKSSTEAKPPRRRTATLAVAVAAGLLGYGLGGGPPSSDPSDGWVSWATAKASQISAMISPKSPLAPAASVTQKVTVKQR
ncbi:MAG: hypothetical protein ABIP19_09865 [Dermatophilaceae bacterium]